MCGFREFFACSRFLSHFVCSFILYAYFFLFHYTYIICCSSQNDVDDQDSSKFSKKRRRKQTSWTKMKKKWKKLMNERLFIFYFCCLLYNKGMWIRFGWMEYLCAVWDSGWMFWMGLRVSNLLRIFVLKILRIFCWDFYLQLELLDNLIEEILKNFYKNFW